MAYYDSSGVKRADTSKGPPLRVLSLDGGGVRGYSMLIILQELMHRTFVEIHGYAPQRHQIPKPCDHFDLIVGTGTGGLIALMLGRLRLDLDTCKDVYVRMTRRVFETDKTFAGIPLRSTLFKASKLEEAIRDCVREHTVFDSEGNDTLANATVLSPMTPMTPGTSASVNPSSDALRRSMSNSSRVSGLSGLPVRPSIGTGRWGNPDALLYDVRENRTKTAVTAVYRGTPLNGASALLRSYDSRGEPAPEFNCTIWEAGRATSATQLAFKPIQIGQSLFLDEGAGKYNPAPQALDEAILNEWPGREVGAFVSVGTGKRPNGTENQQQQWWESFLGGTIGDFAEARRRLITKIEGCEQTHQYMLREHIGRRGVSPENYYRLNVEVGVGEFGMNEWNRLSDISTNTRMYLRREDVQSINIRAAARIARIHRAKLRYNRSQEGYREEDRPNSWDRTPPNEPIPPSNPMAVELPADNYHRASSSYSKRPVSNPVKAQQEDEGKIVVSSDEYPQLVEEGYAANQEYSERPPPIPPKTPLTSGAPPVRSQLYDMRGQPSNKFSQYPDPNGPPPPVNMARKPEYRQ